jgi:DNA repair protein RecO (recombination protein O)
VRQIVTRGIVLTRTNFGEADRIITFLTPNHGKLRLMAKGVRKVKSKLAGGVELLSTSTITYIEGRGEVGTLISARLEKHYGRITKQLERVQLGYDLMGQINRVTEDEPEETYYELLEQSYAALDDHDIPLGLIRTWFDAQLLRLGGHAPNLTEDTGGEKLQQESKYNFDFEAMTFSPHEKGRYMSDHIKLLRLLFSGNTTELLMKVTGHEPLLKDLAPIIRTMSQTHTH